MSCQSLRKTKYHDFGVNHTGLNVFGGWGLFHHEKAIHVSTPIFYFFFSVGDKDQAFVEAPTQFTCLSSITL